MKRDLDYVRELLQQIEGGRRMFETLSSEGAQILGTDAEEDLSDAEAEKRRYHLDLLEDAGLIEIEFRAGGGMYLVKGLTWAGHDFVDAIKDDTVWNQVKEKASQAGGMALSALRDLAVAYGKRELGL